MRIRLAVIVLALGSLCSAEMSPDQRALDFQQLASLFAKRYAFLDWKQDAVKFDALNLKPWLDRVAAAKSDIEYFEICAEYAAAFKDGHTGFGLPSDFVATLGFSVDLYDGRPLIDNIDRKRLPEDKFPFQIGDELISVDGRTVRDWLSDISRLNGGGYARATQRYVATLITSRVQSYYPRAHEIGDSAVVVVSRRYGATETWTLPWLKSGTPYLTTSPSPGFRSAVAAPRSITSSDTETDLPAAAPTWPKSLNRIRSMRVMRSRFWNASLGIGAVAPVFALPATFVQRVGSGKYDTLFSGTFTAQGLTIGFLRVGSFEGLDTTTLQKEIRFMEQSTDGLILDVMRNPGGYGCSAETLLRHFAPNGIHSAAISVRVTWDYIAGLESDLELANAYGDDPDVITEIQQELAAAKAAYSSGKGLTTPMPICGPSQDLGPAVDRSGKLVTYSKPVMLLIDDRTASAAELFASVMQDENRATLFGYRTSGAGGSVDTYLAGVYSETSVSMAIAILLRKNGISSSEYPTAPYIENIGVRPDTVVDYMTDATLLDKGAGFSAKVSAAMVDYINSKR